MTATVTVWSDIHCPWAFVTVHRLRAARQAHALDVVFDQRAWPLELVNGRGTPKHIVPVETAVLANHEPAIFSAFRGDEWPSTFLPAFELVAAARQVHGVRAAEDVDYALRLAFFRDSVDVSVRAGLSRVLADCAALNAADSRSADPRPAGQRPADSRSAGPGPSGSRSADPISADPRPAGPGSADPRSADSGTAGPGAAALDPDAILAVWDSGVARADVLADYRCSKELPIQGSPQVFWPDGSSTHNPGMTDHEWVRGIPRIRSTDPDEPGRLLRAALTAAGS